MVSSFQLPCFAVNCVDGLCSEVYLPLPGWEGQGIALLSSIFPSPSAQETTYTLVQYLAILPSHLDNVCLFTTVLGIVLRSEAISVWPSEVTNS